MNQIAGLERVMHLLAGASDRHSIRLLTDVASFGLLHDEVHTMLLDLRPREQSGTLLRPIYSYPRHLPVFAPVV